MRSCATESPVAGIRRNEMVKMINCIFGNEMWVSEDRLQEYLKAGHRLPGVHETTKTKTTRQKKEQKK